MDDFKRGADNLRDLLDGSQEERAVEEPPPAPPAPEPQEPEPSAGLDFIEPGTLGYEAGLVKAAILAECQRFHDRASMSTGMRNWLAGRVEKLLRDHAGVENRFLAAARYDLTAYLFGEDVRSTKDLRPSQAMGWWTWLDLHEPFEGQIPPHAGSLLALLWRWVYMQTYGQTSFLDEEPPLIITDHARDQYVDRYIERYGVRPRDVDVKLQDMWSRAMQVTPPPHIGLTRAVNNGEEECWYYVVDGFRFVTLRNPTRAVTIEYDDGAYGEVLDD